MTTPPAIRSCILVLVAGLVLAACSSSGAAPSGTPSNPGGSPSTSPGGAGPSVDPGSDTPVGTDAPPSNGAGGGGQAGGRLVVPKPGQIDPHPIRADSLSAVVDGRRVVVTVAYTSGVEPCNVLDSIVVTTGDHTFDIVLREGHGPGDGVCIEIAEFKRAQVDLGELAPGTYTISNGPDGAAAIQVVVP
jgi:hypothetical protein